MPPPRPAADPTRVRLSRAALELFSERGFHATGIREIGARAGVSTSAMYQYVRSKDDALGDLILDGLSRHRDALAAACDSVPRPEEKLVALVSVQLIVPVRHRAMSRLLQREMPLHDWSGHAQISTCQCRIQQLWATVLAGGREEGIFEFAAERVARIALRRATTEVTRWYLEGDATPLPDLVAQFADIALGTVRARRGRRYLRAAHVRNPTFEAMSRLVDAAHEGVWW
jgi:TetR/AcrR family transcriptional regulator, cholesterol catabolism regulator